VGRSSNRDTSFVLALSNKMPRYKIQVRSETGTNSPVYKGSCHLLEPTSENKCSFDFNTIQISSKFPFGSSQELGGKKQFGKGRRTMLYGKPRLVFKIKCDA
jgi:hypothetical protein